MRTLITRDGQVYPEECFGLRPLVGFASLQDLIDYAVRDCGAVLLEHQCRFRISVRPGLLSAAAFEKLVSYLAQADGTPIIIVPIASPETLRDVFFDTSDAIARLDQFREHPELTPEGLRFKASPVSTRRLVETRQPRVLSAAYRTWLQSRGRLSRTRMTQLLDHPIGASCMLARPGCGGMPIVETLPFYFMNFWGSMDFDPPIGKPMTDLPDPVYAEGVADGFREVVRHAEPRLETIDALVTREDASVSVVRYDRLVLPWTTPGGERLISSNSFSRRARR
jgi:hypothetical protein